MASVEQARDAVEAEHQHAAEMTAKALSAIDTVVALSTHTLTFVAIVLALVGAIGAVAIYVGAREMARKIATQRIDAYLKTSEGAAYLRSALADEIRMQIEQKIVVVVQPGGSVAPPSPSQFPPPPHSGVQL